MIFAGTGHRPNKIFINNENGYNVFVQDRLTKLVIAALTHYQPIKVISGMALGFDMALAEAAISLSIPFIAAVPFKCQDRVWPKESQHKYKSLLKQAAEIKITSEGNYSASKMQIRNKWMVDNCDKVLALWDGTTGGTANCIKYANKSKKLIINLWKSWEQYK